MNVNHFLLMAAVAGSALAVEVPPVPGAEDGDHRAKQQPLITTSATSSQLTASAAPNGMPANVGVLPDRLNVRPRAQAKPQAPLKAETPPPEPSEQERQFKALMDNQMELQKETRMLREQIAEQQAWFAKEAAAREQAKAEEEAKKLQRTTVNRPKSGWQYPARLIEIENKVEEYNFNPTEPELSEAEKRSLAIREQHESSYTPPIYADNMLKFTYGMSQVFITCAVLNITDVQLQAGELIKAIAIGDSARWSVHTAVSGENTPHVIIKPFDTGLQTTLMVNTDRRTYYLNLSSSRQKFMPRVGFVYPDEEMRVFQAQQKKIEEQRLAEEAARRLDTIPETNEYLGDLCFDYKISGRASWKPLRVYHDRIKTIIEMPDRIQEMPTLLVIRNKKEENLVNYRVQNGRFIVDSIFDKAVMVAGVGKRQEKVTIELKERKMR